MRKYILSLLAMVLISSAAFAQSVAKVQGMKKAEGKPQPALVNQPYTDADLPDGESNVFAYLFYQNSLQTRGIINFTTTDTQHYTLLSDWGAHTNGDTGLYSGTFVKDRYFGQGLIIYNNGAYLEYNGPLGLVEVDPKTGENTVVGEWKSAFGSRINDLAYDDDNDLLLGCVDDKTGISSSFYMIDYNNPTDLPQYLMKTENGIVIQTMAAENGVLYALANVFSTDYSSYVGAKLYSYNIAEIKAGTAKANLIGEVKMPGDFISYSSSMAMDKNNHRLYILAQPDDGKAYWLEIDKTNGQILKQEENFAGLQCFGIAFPYQSVAKGTPSYLRNFKAEAGDKGALKATFSWTLPTEKAEGGSLADAITGVNVYRDGQKITTLAGTATSWEDNAVTNGTHEYKFHAVNAKGEGMYSSKTLFVGVDLPGAPLNAKVAATGTTATITWDAPAKGINNGYFDPAQLTYTVVRNDGKEIAKDINVTTATDTEENTAPYNYTITVKNAAGVGGSAKTNTVSIGSGYNLPFNSVFDSEEAFGFWSVIDKAASEDGTYIFDNLADGTTWKWDEVGWSALYYGGANGACDFLISPALKMKKGVDYRLQYKYQISNYKDCYESFEVLLSKEASFEGLRRGGEDCKAVLLDEYVDINPFDTSFNLVEKKFNVEEDGNYYIAFYVKSKGSMGNLAVKDITVREYMDNDLTAVSFECSDQGRPDHTTNVRVKILNNGKKNVAGSAYKVNIIDTESNEVLASAEGKDIEAGKNAIVAVPWTPEMPGTYNLKGVVEFAEDGYKDDNTTTQTMTCEITNNADITDWVSVGINDLNGCVAEGTSYFDAILGMTMIEGKSFVLYDKELLGVKDCYLTHIRYMFDGEELCESDIEYPITVSIATTEDEFMPIQEDPRNVENGEIGFGPMTHNYGFRKVYDGEVDLSAPERNQWLTIELDEPYYVSGDENIIINLCSKSQSTGTVHWHCYKTDNFVSAVVGVKDSSRIDAIYYHLWGGAEDWFFASGLRPYTRLGFSDDIEGIQSVEAATAKNAVYNLQGQRVNNKNLQSGIYVKNGKKFIVK